MNILFVHFPKDSDQIGGIELPNYFANLGHNVYAVFEKRNRIFKNKFLGNFQILDVSDNIIKEIDYDIVIAKSNAYQNYGHKYLTNSKKAVKFNLMPMGIKNNKLGIDYSFGENEIIKSPVRSMQKTFKRYMPWEKRKNQVIIGASIGTDKNQLEFINFVEREDIYDYKILFAGPVASQNYMNQMKNQLDKKQIRYEYLGYISREELAVHLQESKLSILTTDPRPHQPFDPGPRIIYESTLAGTPCLINDLVLVYPDSEKYCFRYCNKDYNSFKEAINKIHKTDLAKLSNNAYQFGKENYTIENSCNQIYQKVISFYKNRVSNV